MTLEWFGLLGSLALLVVLTMRGVDLLLDLLVARGVLASPVNPMTFIKAAKNVF